MPLPDHQREPLGAPVRTMMNILAYADAEHNLIALERIGINAFDCATSAE
jgi:hypothetical protein